MLGWIWSLIIGGIIGAIAGALTSRDLPAGWLGNIVAGLLGSWGPSLAGMALIPSILGAVILVVIVSIIFGMRKKG